MKWTRWFSPTKSADEAARDALARYELERLHAQAQVDWFNAKVTFYDVQIERLRARLGEDHKAP